MIPQPSNWCRPPNKPLVQGSRARLAARMTNGAERLVRLLAAAIICALVISATAPAYAQYANAPDEDLAKKAQREDAEKAYQRAMKDRGANAPTTKVDPWGAVRTTDPQQNSSATPSKSSK